MNTTARIPAKALLLLCLALVLNGAGCFILILADRIWPVGAALISEEEADGQLADEPVETARIAQPA